MSRNDRDARPGTNDDELSDDALESVSGGHLLAAPSGVAIAAAALARDLGGSGVANPVGTPGIARGDVGIA